MPLCYTLREARTFPGKLTDKMKTQKNVILLKCAKETDPYPRILIPAIDWTTQTILSDCITYVPENCQVPLPRRSSSSDKNVQIVHDNGQYYLECPDSMNACHYGPLLVVNKKELVHLGSEKNDEPMSENGSTDIPTERSELSLPEWACSLAPDSFAMHEKKSFAKWCWKDVKEECASRPPRRSNENVLPQNAIQRVASSLIPYPKGILWARTTGRWFAIYKETNLQHPGKKKFKTFDPKKFGGDCWQAYTAACEFLKVVEPWQSCKDGKTRSASQWTTTTSD